MAKYRKKPVVIDAIEYRGDNVGDVVKFIGSSVFEKESMIDGSWVKTLDIETLEGVMKATQGDYIIKGVQGEFYPCKPDIFKATYEEVKE